MNKKIIIILTILIILIPSTASYIAEASPNNTTTNNITYYDKGFRYNIQGWVYLHIEGEPYERGYQYGYLASAEIIDTLIRWSNLAHNFKFMKIFIIKNQPENYDQLSEQWWKICRAKAMRLFYDKVPEEYKQEMKGMADGLKAKNCQIFGRDIEFEDVVASQFVQEVWYGCFKYLGKRIHPLRSLLNGVKEILTEGDKNPPIGHCNAFIATGEYTSGGQIVIAHSTVFNKNIAQRCNIILDVQPSNGYRFTMTCPPGSLWSQEDYYQNDQGIVLTETELLPQGPFNIRKTPKGVRSRNAIQYSKNIDEVIQHLQKGNSGLIPNEWLIGDTKTGEIASLEQALYNTPIKRTKSGFYWSCNTPHDEQVKRELTGIAGPIYNLISKSPNSVYAQKGQKFIELSKIHRGEIDTEIAKQILTADPIIHGAMDAKITDTSLMKDMGLITFLGIPSGETFIPTNELKEMYHKITDLPASGWVEIYPANSKPNKLENKQSNSMTKQTAKVLWTQEIEKTGSTQSSSNIVSNDIVVSSFSTNKIYAMNAGRGKEIWTRKIEDKIYSQDASGEFIVVGTDKGVCAINKETGNIEWYQYIGKTINKPRIVDDIVVSSCTNGEFYAFEVSSGKIKWNYDFPAPGEISQGFGDIICIGSGNSCYSMNVKTSETKWKFETDGKITATPRSDGKITYFGSWDGNIYAVDLSTGEEKWKYETGWGIDTTPALSKDMIYFGSNDNKFYALNKDDGKLVWYFDCNSAIHASPTVYGDYVFFGSDDGRLYALDKNTGALGWDFSPEYSMSYNDVNNYITTPILSDPVVENSIVYITAKGSIYALDAQTIEMQNAIVKNNEFSFGIFVLIFYSLLILLGSGLLLRIYIKKRKSKD